MLNKYKNLTYTCFLTIPLKESCKIGHNQNEQETESRKPNDWVKSWLSKQTKIIVQILDPGSSNLHLRDLYMMCMMPQGGDGRDRESAESAVICLLGAGGQPSCTPGLPRHPYWEPLPAWGGEYTSNPLADYHSNNTLLYDTSPNSTYNTQSDVINTANFRNHWNL